jgi:hypothetical protein
MFKDTEQHRGSSQRCTGIARGRRQRLVLYVEEKPHQRPQTVASPPLRGLCAYSALSVTGILPLLAKVRAPILKVIGSQYTYKKVNPKEEVNAG